MSQPAAKPSMPYWHVYTDADGMSRQEMFALTDFELKGVSPDVDAAVERQDGAVAGGRDLHGPAGRLGRRLAREPEAAMDRRS